MPAYNESYLDDAMNNLGDMFDYAVNDCGITLADFCDYFNSSGVAEAYANGNPKYIAGLSGPELASEVLYRTFGKRPETPSSVNYDKSREYWTGWILAYYQWFREYSFPEMQESGLTAEYVYSLYETLHEADISKFVSIADRIMKGERK